MENVDEDKDEHGLYEMIHENSSTGIRVYRFSDPNNAIGGGRTGSVAVKVLARCQEGPHSDSDSDPARRLKMLHDEFELSSMPALSTCPAVRAALRRTMTRDGSHAIWLEWAGGVTLEEWLRRDNDVVAPTSSPTALYNGLCLRVDLARAIAGAVAELHDACVVHNNICLANVIVDDHSVDKSTCIVEADEGRDDDEHVEFSVKIIDLGSAVLLKGNDPIVSMRARRKDLYSLGAILYEKFCGECPTFQQNTCQMLPSKVPIANDPAIAFFPPLLHDLEGKLCLNGIPQCLAMLVSKLMWTGKEGTVGCCYQSAGEVKQDLDHIRAHSDRFLADDIGSRVATGGTLEFPSDRLYGRAEEVSAVSDVFDRIVRGGGRSEMVLISGASGAGKTALVRHVQGTLVKRGGVFLTGKFDLMRQVEALSATNAAFTEFCESVLSKGGDDLRRLRMALQDVVGSDGISVLMDFVPSLQRVMGPDHPAAVKMVVGGKEAQHRLAHLFRLLARAISGKSRPLVMFLDDLQWADVASLDLMRNLIVDNENKFLFIGSYRNNEVDSSNPLSVRLGEIEALGVPITKIEIQNISEKDAMNCLISETLRVPLSVSNQLAAVVHSRTGGNFFFAKQFLTSLRDIGLLRYSTQSGSWQWNLHQIESIDVADSAIGLTMQNIAQLPLRTRRAMGVAACLGCHCDEDILRLIEGRDVGEGCIEKSIPCERSSHDSFQGLAEALDVAVDRRLMGKDRTRYCFLHDQICQAALSLIPETARADLHQHIGMSIWNQSQQTILERYLFVAVDHLYLGLSQVAEHDKIGLAQLFLRAGQKAISLSLFVPASTYLKAGIDLLGPDHWTRHYDLSLQLFTMYADTEYCNGGEMGYFLDQIMENATCFDHRLGAYYTLVNSLGGRGKLLDAVHSNFLVLQELGESFPAKGSLDFESYTLDEFEETRGMLDEFTDETLLTMKEMTDERKLWAMKFLNLLTVHTYLAEQDYLPLAAMRMVQLTLSYGTCKEESAVGFAWFGLVLCSQIDDVKRGYQFGQLALKLLERSESKERLSRVYTIVYGCINHWTKPLRLSLEPILHSHHMGLRSGDVEFSMANVFDYCLIGLQSGVQLASLEGSLREITHTMREYKQTSILVTTLILWQFVLNLMGRSVDPLRLTGDAMDQEKMEKHWVEINGAYCLCRLYFFRMWLAYLYGEYTLAAEMAEKSRNIDKVNPSEFAVSNHAFLDGLISLALARKTKQRIWRITANKALEKLKSWSTHAPCNFHHKVDLLEAELAFLEEDWGKANRSFEAGIALAGENGFIQDQALASERAAVFHLACGDQERASKYYEQAYAFYLEWGALGKADHVKRCLLSMFSDDSS